MGTRASSFCDHEAVWYVVETALVERGTVTVLSGSSFGVVSVRCKSEMALIERLASGMFSGNCSNLVAEWRQVLAAIAVVIAI